MMTEFPFLGGVSLYKNYPNFDSWLQIFSCFTLLSNILEDLIVPWIRSFCIIHVFTVEF